MREITKKFIVKSWDELTQEEKEKQINKYQEIIWEDNERGCYDDFLWRISDLKSRLKYITFDDLYIDENSQGYWIEKVNKFNIYIELDGNVIDDIDFRIRKYIDDIQTIRINNEWWRIEEVAECNIVNELKNEFELFKNEINDAVKEYFNRIWDIDEDFINFWFEGMEFEFEEE